MATDNGLILPETIVNGDDVDAGPVMENFNYLLGVLNSAVLDGGAGSGLDLAGKQIHNVGDATAAGDAVNLNQITGPSIGAAVMISSAADGAVDQAAGINAHLVNSRRLHVPVRYGPSATSRYAISSPILIVQSGTHLSFDRGARFVPFNGIDPGAGIKAVGAAPVSWTNLSADAAEGQNTFTVATDPGWAVGDWVEIRADTLITGVPNSQGNKVGCLRKITARSGTGPVTFTVNKELPYTFTTADTGKAGKATVIENLIIDGAQLNDENFGTNIMSFPIYLSYCAYVTILNPRGFGSKLPYAADVTTGDFIKINNCFDVEVHNPFMRHGGYYGISIVGMCEDIRSYGGAMEDVRHAVSVVYGAAGSNGQPLNVLIDGMTARYTTLSSFDTHDTGRDIRFISCLAESAGDDGYQARTPYVSFIQCVSRYAYFDGFSQNTGANGLRAVNCSSLYSGRYGVNWNYADSSWIGGRVSNNGSTSARGGLKSGGGPGFNMYGGLISGARIENNGGTAAIIHGTIGLGQSPLLIADCDIPASATQVSLLAAPVGMDLGLATLRNNNDISGYGNNMFQNFGTVTNVSPVSSGNQIASTGSQRKGRVTLVGGKATVSNTAVRNKLSAAYGEAIVSQIALRRATASGLPGSLYVESITDQFGFTIKSTNFVEPTRTNVVRNNTNVGVTNGAIGSGGVLPTNWSLSAVSGLTTTIVSTGTETGPLGGTQNYIDIRVNGTAGAAGSHILFFDTASNSAAAASAGQAWTGSFGAKLTTGAMTGLSPVIGLSSYTSGGAAVDNFNTAITIGATGQRFTRTGTLTGAAAFARTLVNFVTTNGATIDATIRIYMPQLEQASDGSAPIATSGSAATRTADTTNADNSTVDWEMTL